MSTERRERWFQDASGQGFTLPELMIVIVLLGILAAIAIPSFFGLNEAKAATAGANQIASDLRLANGTARNRLSAISVQVDTTKKCPGEDAASGRWYRVTTSPVKERCLPEGSKFLPGPSQVQFSPDGSASLTGGSEIKIARASRSAADYRITINTQTSGVRVIAQ